MSMPASMPLPMDCTGTEPMVRASIRAPAPSRLPTGAPKPWGIFDGDGGTEVDPRHEASASNVNADVSSGDSATSVEESTDDDDDDSER